MQQVQDKCSAPESCRDLAAIAHADADITELLAECFLRPTFKLGIALREGTLFHDLAELVSDQAGHDVLQALDVIGSYREQFATFDDNQCRLALEVDYNRLFVGPARLLAPPYESFYTTPGGEDGRGRLRGPAEREVRATYLSNGFAMPETFVDFPDHVAIELDFLAAMADKEARLWEEGDEEGAMAVIASEDAFRERHLEAWFPKLKADIESGSQTDFYPAIAALVSGLVLEA